MNWIEDAIAKGERVVGHKLKEGARMTKEEERKYEGKPMTLKYYCVVMVGGLEPVVHGPYDSEEVLATQAKVIHRSLKDEDNLFGMEINHQGSPEVWTYSNRFFAEDL